MQSFLKPKVFGLDVSESSIKLADGEKLVRIPINNKKERIEALRKAIKQARISNMYAAASIPEKYSFIQLVPEGQNLEQIIEENIPLPIDKIYYDWEKTKYGWLVVAAAKTIVDEYLDFIHQAGLIVEAVEPESVATVRALKPDQGVIMIIDMGLRGPSFIICSSDAIYFTAYRPQSEVPDSQTLAKQALEYVSYVEKKFLKRAKKIILCGGKAKKRNLEQEIEQRTGIKTQKAKKRLFVTAIGLSLKKDQKINLLPLASKKRIAKEHSLRLGILITIILTTASLLSSSILNIVNNKFPYDYDFSSLDILNQKIDILEKKEALLKQIPGNFQTEIIANIYRLKSDHIKFLSLDIKEKEIKLKAHAQTRKDMLDFAESLNYFYSVESPLENLTNPQDFDFSLLLKTNDK